MELSNLLQVPQPASEEVGFKPTSISLIHFLCRDLNWPYTVSPTTLIIQNIKWW